jgi:hypothetical protein
MQKPAFVLMAFLFFLPFSAMAQEYPRVEAFGGYSYFRANPGGDNLNGWNGSVAGNITSWFGVVGDFSGHYGAPKAYGFTIPYVNINSYTFMAGPKLSARMGAITPFAHFLIGAARASTGSLGLSVSDTALAAAVGGGIDIKVNNWMAIRAAQADYLMTRYRTYPDYFYNFSERQNNFRFSAGIVFLLGNH